jgi:phosphoribosylglycinamide formyltransferase-1
MKKIIIFASGNGTNTQNIINYFRDSDVVISKIICNYSVAKVLDIARNENIESIIISKDQLDTDGVLNLLRQLDPDLIVLAGFLLKIPKSLTDTFNIVNLHPSLLPKFGGKGMWGMNVHKAVIESFEEESGITIHWVNENYDEGNIIKQYNCKVSDLDTPETLSEKIKELELNYPSVIKSIL